MDGGDVFVVQLRRALGLLLQAVTESGIPAVFQTDHFDCDSPSEQAVLCKEHLAHGAAAESCLNRKTIDAAAGQIADWGLQHGKPANETRNCMPATDCVAAGWRAMSLLRTRGVRESRELRVLGKSEAYSEGSADAVTRGGETSQVFLRFYAFYVLSSDGDRQRV